jgi:hypothetical protein
MIGPVEVLPLITHSKCKWRIAPSTRDTEVDSIDLAVKVVRQKHSSVRQ